MEITVRFYKLEITLRGFIVEYIYNVYTARRVRKITGLSRRQFAFYKSVCRHFLENNKLFDAQANDQLLYRIKNNIKLDQAWWNHQQDSV